MNQEPDMPDFNRVARDVVVAPGARVHAFANLYGCTIGPKTTIGAFVEIQSGVTVGARCKISSHSFLCTGVTIADDVFVGHHVCFTNDRFPRSTNSRGEPQGPEDWVVAPTHVAKGASIGSGVVILPGVTIGEGAMVGAGSVVTQDVPPRTVVAGNPARIIRMTVEPGG
ncbi:MAG TPA: acyltransferase [Acidimicrobiales bacterium]|nr:acyltransferase [Acidimicrobiales bacterium]